MVDSERSEACHSGRSQGRWRLAGISRGFDSRRLHKSPEISRFPGKGLHVARVSRARHVGRGDEGEDRQRTSSD
jgi:hypothetical protein